MSRLRERGDTIVEVLVAIAIVSLVLVGAFVVTNKTLANARQSQEHDEALKLLQGQVEKLRAKAAITTIDQDEFFSTNNFCLAVEADNFVVYNDTAPQCNISKGSFAYKISVKQYSASDNVFIASIRWPSLVTPSNTENVEIAYKVFPKAAP